MEEDFLKSKMKATGSPLVTLAGNNVKTEVFGYVEVTHGLNDNGDYIWQFAQLKKQRPFPNKLDYFYDVISKGLDVLFNGVEFIYYPPPSDWEVKVIGVKAVEVGKLWNFYEEDMSNPLPGICEKLNEYLDKMPRPKRRI